MQSITPPRPVEHHPIAPLVTDTVIGTILIVGGVTFGVAVFATPLLTMLVPAGRLSPDRMVIGMAIWGIALVAPAAAILLGTTRLARILGSVRRYLPRRSPLHQALGSMPEGVTIASGITLPDGRPLADVLLGPFGAAVIRELPSAAATRVVDGHWELRTSRGWIPMESPLDRAVRDAERVRRWFGADDADFVVKVYAAVTAPTTSVERTVACAVVPHDQLLAWVSGLPLQRSLTAGRQERMLEIVREAAAGA